LLVISHFIRTRRCGSLVLPYFSLSRGLLKFVFFLSSTRHVWSRSEVLFPFTVSPGPLPGTSTTLILSPPTAFGELFSILLLSPVAVLPPELSHLWPLFDSPPWFSCRRHFLSIVWVPIFQLSTWKDQYLVLPRNSRLMSWRFVPPFPSDLQDGIPLIQVLPRYFYRRIVFEIFFLDTMSFFFPDETPRVLLNPEVLSSAFFRCGGGFSANCFFSLFFTRVLRLGLRRMPSLFSHTGLDINLCRSLFF